MNSKPLTMDDILKAIEKVKAPVWESEDLDKFMETHKDIRKVMMVSGNEKFRELDYVTTKYGNLKIQYNFFMEPDKVFFVYNPLEGIKPNFNF